MNKDLLYSMENYTQYLLVPVMEKNLKRIYIYIYMYIYIYTHTYISESFCSTSETNTIL